MYDESPEILIKKSKRKSLRRRPRNYTLFFDDEEETSRSIYKRFEHDHLSLSHENITDVFGNPFKWFKCHICSQDFSTINQLANHYGSNRH